LKAAIKTLYTARVLFQNMLSFGVMTLLERIREDLKTAMRAKDELRRDTLRGILSACTNELVAKGLKPTEALDEGGVLAVLKKLAKQRKDAIEQFSAGGREELAEKERSELSILETYLPQMASREDIERVARAKKEEMGVDAKGMGKLMGAVMKELEGNADGAIVKEVVASLFS
jgi:uncharacterized protein